MSNYPAPKLAAKGKASKYAGKVLIANPALKGVNPREPGHGYRAFNYLLKAGEAGLTYEAFRDLVNADPAIKGFSNHLKWDTDRNYTVIKK